MTKFRFHYPIGVRYGDLDPQWHVNHTRFLTFIEQARLDGKSFWDLPLIVGDIHCRYLVPIEPGETVIVSMGVTKIGNKSLTMEYAVTGENDSPLYATAETIMVSYDYHSHSAIPVSDELRRLFGEFEGKTF
jgi:acyl-CoA thioester hydrolase